jgi:hypothetical protein
VPGKSFSSVSKARLIFGELYADSIHKKEKDRIVKNSIMSALKSCDSGSRLEHFLSNAEEILKNAEQNYELFVSDFSFQDDREKLFEQKRDFSGKLNSLLIGIQGKLLAIPVSTILATSQFKDEADSNQFLVNTSIMVSAACFLLIICWLIRSQVHAIKSIGDEIDIKQRRFRVQLSKLYSEVSSVFTSLKSSCDLNLRMAYFLIVLSFLLFFATWYIYLVKTPEFFELITSIVKSAEAVWCELRGQALK